MAKMVIWIIKHDSAVCCLQKAHLKFKVKVGWKWKDGKRYTMQIISKRCRGGYINIIQNIV